MTSDIGLPKGMSRDDAYVQGVADGEEQFRKVLQLLLSVGIEDEVAGGFLECRYCGKSNMENDPPEDDAVKHTDDCAGKAAYDLLDRTA